MLILEALRAKFGDCLLLHFGTAATPRLAVIDGGPPGVFNDALRPRLDQIRAGRNLAEGTPLDIDLMMVSHIDSDHVAGLLELVRKIKDLRESGKPVPWRIERFWHNSFDDLLSNDDLAVGSSASAVSAASMGGLLLHEGSNLLASVGQGRDLRKLLLGLQLGGNVPLGGLVRAGQSPVTIGGSTWTVIAPSETNLKALQKDWDQKIKPILKKETSPTGLAEIAAYLDKSVYNLSSIVVLAEADEKRVLLTGDGRGDHTLEGLEQAGLLDATGRIEIDVLKVPHHGSDRDVDVDYFQRIRAKHLVISADGKHDNPDVDTLEMISEARPDDDFTIYLTYPTDAFNVPAVGAAVATFFTKERAAGRQYKVEARPSGDLGLTLNLA